jgi:hypothetical protein
MNQHPWQACMMTSEMLHNGHTQCVPVYSMIHLRPQPQLRPVIRSITQYAKSRYHWDAPVLWAMS